MIYLDRKKLVPSAELLEDATFALDRATEIVSHSKRRERIQLKSLQMIEKEFSTRWRHEVAGIFDHKCAYCESRTESDAGSVDRFRPIQNAVGYDGTVSPDHYWWLLAEWRNIYWSCRVCNAKKSNHFPIEEKNRASHKAPWENVTNNESNLLIDPCLQDPTEHLEFDSSGEFSPLTELGSITIELLALNRTPLVRGRRRETIHLLQEIATFNQTEDSKTRLNQLSVIEELLQPSSEFAGAKRQIMKQELARFGADLSTKKQLEIWGQGLPISGIYQLLEAQPIGAKATSRSRKRHVEISSRADHESMSSQLQKIEITRFRAIQHLVLEFPEQTSDEEPWIVLVGENGVGKSTVLKAVALLGASTKQLKKLVPNPSTCITRGSRNQTGSIRAWFSNDEEPDVELVFSKKSNAIERRGKAPRRSLLAYGATRLPPAPSWPAPSKPTRFRVENLFDPRAPLSHLEKFFSNTSQVSADQFNLMAASLRTILDLEESGGLVTRREGKVFINSGNGPIELEEQSDGYRSVAALVGDMMMNLGASVSDFETVRGTVLIDEIGCHLHPRWRIRIVEMLRQVFPRVRFIVTTHEPLCLRGARPGEIYRLYQSEKDGSISADLLDIPPGLTADQLLTGQWFGLGSTLDVETSQMMLEHSHLITESKKTKEISKRIDLLENELGDRLGNFASTSLETSVRRAMVKMSKEMNLNKPLTKKQKSTLSQGLGRLKNQLGKTER